MSNIIITTFILLFITSVIYLIFVYIRAKRQLGFLNLAIEEKDKFETGITVTLQDFSPFEEICNINLDKIPNIDETIYIVYDIEADRLFESIFNDWDSFDNEYIMIGEL